MNPYKLIFDLFYEINLKFNTAIFIDKKEVYIKIFNEWIEEFYFNRIHNPQFLKIYMDKTCNFLIETCEESNPFDCTTYIEKIKKYDGLKSETLFECLNKSNSIQFEFNQMYKKENAKKIYHLLKKYFLNCDCDPFSFTTEIISDLDKKKFLHDIM